MENLTFENKKLKEENMNLKLKIEGLNDFYNKTMSQEIKSQAHKYNLLILDSSHDKLLIEALEFYLKEKGNFTNREKINNLIINLKNR